MAQITAKRKPAPVAGDMTVDGVLNAQFVWHAGSQVRQLHLGVPAKVGDPGAA